MESPDVSRLEKAIENAVRDLKAEIQIVKRDAGKQIAELRRDVNKATEFQVGFRVVSRVMTFLLAVATAGAAVYGAFIR